MQLKYVDTKEEIIAVNKKSKHIEPVSYTHLDRRLKPLLDLCTKYDKSVLFHSGFSWEPDSPSKYTRPILFEDIAVEYPTLRFCLSHLGWPWVDELCKMCIRDSLPAPSTSTGC